MSIEVGEKVKGKVSGITNFGAFIDLGDKKKHTLFISVRSQMDLLKIFMTCYQ